MEKRQFNSIIVALAVLFLMCCMNTCNSCSAVRKADEVKTTQAKSDSMSLANTAVLAKQFELQMQMMQPQVVNQFLQIFNGEKYKNEITLNQTKIELLQQQIKTLNEKNDTSKAH